MVSNLNALIIYVVGNYFNKNQSIVGVMGHMGNWEWGAMSHQVYFKQLIKGVIFMIEKLFQAKEELEKKLKSERDLKFKKFEEKKIKINEEFKNFKNDNQPKKKYKKI